MIRQTLGHLGGLWQLPLLILFVCLFVGLTLRLLKRGAARYQKEARLPLEEEDSWIKTR